MLLPLKITESAHPTPGVPAPMLPSTTTTPAPDPSFSCAGAAPSAVAGEQPPRLAAPAQTLPISTFHSQKDNLPARGEASWEQLVDSLSSPRAASCTAATCKRSDCPDKSGLSWAPAVWPVGYKRGNIGVEAVSALVVDIDHVTDDDQLFALLEGIAAHRYVVHASHSDRPGDRCVRVVLAISRPVHGHEWKRFWRASMEQLKLPGDGQTCDPAHLFYAPSRPSDAQDPDKVDGTGYLFGVNEGEPIDVDAILASAPFEPAPVADNDEFQIPAFTGAPEPAKLEAAAHALADAWPSTGRHGAQLALAGALARAGWPVELIASFCARVAEIQEPGNSDLPKRSTAARSSVDKVIGGEPVQGWPSLIEIIGEDAVSSARGMLGFQVIQHDQAFLDSVTAQVPAEEPAPVAPKDVTAESDDEGTSTEFTVDHKTGKPHPYQHNIRVALRKLGVRVRFDAFARRKMIDVGGTSAIVEDHHVTGLWLTVEREFGFRPGKDYFGDVVEREARAHAHHPVREYLEGLTWDGVPRIDTWLVRYFGARDDAYTRAVGRLPLIAAVRRVRQPGCKFDEMLILEGGTGKGKSTALEIMAVKSEWYTDDLQLDVETRRLMESILGKWIVEAGELKGLSKADRGALKSTLSRKVDDARQSYGRENAIRPRECVIIGTTNQLGDYLTDDTGNRRFWPVATGELDLVALARDRDQLWAEAAAAEASGESIRMDASLWEVAAKEQESRREMGPIEERLRVAIEGVPHGKIRTEHVRQLAGFSIGGKGDPSQAELTKIGEAMRAMGWKRSTSQLRFKSGRGYAYVRGTDTEREVERTYAELRTTAAADLTPPSSPPPPCSLEGSGASEAPAAGQTS